MPSTAQQRAFLVPAQTRAAATVPAAILSFSIQPHRVLLRLALAISLLLIAHDAVLALSIYAGHSRVFGLGPLFDLDAEQNISTLFSSLLIFSNAALCVLLWKVERSQGRSDGMWLVLASALAWVAVDEFCSFHEQLAQPVRQSLNSTGLLYFAWVIPYGIAVVVLVATLMPFLARLPSRTRWLMISAGAIYVFGAVVMEMLGGRTFEQSANTRAPLWMVLTTFEEVFEMVGMAIFTYAALDLLVRVRGVAVIRLHGPSISRPQGIHPRAS